MTVGGDFEIGQQHTHGESHPEHFLVKTGSATTLIGPATPTKILPAIGQMRLKAPLCLLSIQKGKPSDAENPQVNR